MNDETKPVIEGEDDLSLGAEAFVPPELIQAMQDEGVSDKSDSRD